MITQFTSKRDPWLTIVISVAAGAIVGAAVLSAVDDQFFIAGMLFLSVAAMLWVFFGTRYTVTESELIVRSGPLRWRIERSTITSVKPTRDPIASPASSLDRLEVSYAGGSKRILVSPADKAGFCAALNAAS